VRGQTWLLISVTYPHNWYVAHSAVKVTDFNALVNSYTSFLMKLKHSSNWSQFPSVPHSYSFTLK